MRLLTRPGPGRLVSVALLATVVALAATGAAPAASREDDEVRLSGSCGGGARAELRLRADDDEIELRFVVARAPGRASWRVAVVHERRVVWRGQVRPQGASRSFRVRRTLEDLDGADAVMVRAWGPRGAGCRASATLSDD